MKLLIKNMVSMRCILIVKSTLEELNIPYSLLELGEVETTGNVPHEKLRTLDNKLRIFGLELKEDKKAVLVEKIKSAIFELINDSDEQLKVTLSDFLSRKLNYSCTYLSNLFSETEGISVEKFFINKKIEHVKELMVNERLNLKEISFRTKYSSVAHLSYQFKKTTGLAPSQFRHLQGKTQVGIAQAAY